MSRRLAEVRIRLSVEILAEVSDPWITGDERHRPDTILARQ
jgi:hypothetical protein